MKIALLTFASLTLSGVVMLGISTPADAVEPVALLIEDKSPAERATIKSDAIIKSMMPEIYVSGKFDIQIQTLEKIDGGIQIFARAWKNDQPVGFGRDGTIEIERFRIFNPPILVPDSNGPIIRESVNLDGELKIRRFREDPAEAIRQVIAQNVGLTGKENASIEAGKVGRTTSTFYSAAGTDSPVDGLVRHHQNSSNWDTVHDATDGTSAHPTTPDDLAAASRKDSSGLFGIYRGFFLFDTSAIPDTDYVGTTTLSLYTDGVQNGDNDGNDFIAILSTSTPASDANLTTADYDQCGSTQAHDNTERKDVTAMAVNVYKDWIFNATGIASLNKTGISKFCAKEGHDLLDDPYAGSNNTSNYFNIAWTDTAGTTQDPKLMVVHQSSAPIAPTSL